MDALLTDGGGGGGGGWVIMGVGKVASPFWQLVVLYRMLAIFIFGYFFFNVLMCVTIFLHTPTSLEFFCPRTEKINVMDRLHLASSI